MKLDTVVRNLKLLKHTFHQYVVYGLDSIRFNVDSRFELFNDRGAKEVKPPESDFSFYFTRAKEIVDHGIIEAITQCLKKHMLVHAEITIRCLHVLSALLDGRSWIGEIAPEEEDKLFLNVRNRVIECDLVNMLLLYVEKKNEKHIVIEAMTVLSHVFITAAYTDIINEP
jgi:hypothetical protein